MFLKGVIIIAKFLHKRLVLVKAIRNEVFMKIFAVPAKKEKQLNLKQFLQRQLNTQVNQIQCMLPEI